MDGILVQDSDWNTKLSGSLAELLEKKLLCDLGIVCGVQNDVSNLKANEVVMVHRCILAGASETIRKLSIGGQVYNLVKINGIEISHKCWNNVLEFVYKGKTEVLSKNLCDVRKAAQVLQIKLLEKAVDQHHINFTSCVCGKKKGDLDLASETSNDSDSFTCTVSEGSWLTTLFEGMLDLLVKQSLCNMTIITEKQEKVSAEILAHLCMLVASSSTIKELVLQGTETYNSVKIDSITYNTWLYLLEYIYTSRVSIVKSNIPEVWIASQLLQIDGLANAVAPFASQMGTASPDDQSLQKQSSEVMNDGSEKSAESLHSELEDVKQESLSDNTDHQIPVLSTVSPTSYAETCFKKENNAENADALQTQSVFNTTDIGHNNLQEQSVVSDQTEDRTSISIEGSPTISPPSSNSTESTSSVLVNQLMQEPLHQPPTQLTSPLLNVNIGLPADAMTVTVGQQLLVPSSTALPSIMTAGVSPALSMATVSNPAAPGITGTGQLINTIQPDGTTAMLWVPNQILPVVNTNTIQPQLLKPVGEAVMATKNDALTNTIADDSPTKLLSIENKEATDVSQDNTCLYFCNKCAHVFSQKSFLDKHKCMKDGNTTTSAPSNGTDMNKLMCKFCKKIFSRTWTLNVHLRTHTGERPYKCKFCSKAFSDKSNMRQHSLIHTSRKEYHCPKCNQAFAQKRYMKKHYMETCRRKYAPEPNFDNLDLGESPAPQQEQNQGAHQKIDSNYIIQYHFSVELNKSVNNSVQSKNCNIDETLGTSDANGSESDVLNIKCDVDLGKQSLGKVDSVDTSNSGSAWDTSIMMVQSQAVGDDIDGDGDDDEDIENDDEVSESELMVLDDSGTSQHQETDDSVKLFCKKCRRHFKTERQKKSHRCMDY